MWIVTVYRDQGYSGENYNKRFHDYDEAEIFFADEIKYEFDEELEEGAVSNQEVQNIINNGIYVYENDKYEVNITLEYQDEELDDSI